MRRLVVASAAFMISASIVSAQATATKPSMQHDMGKMDHMAAPWKEMNDFHKLLAATFHPVKEKKNTKPLREKADALAAAARAWTASTPPTSCGSAEVKSAVAAISTDALAIGNQVLASASDEELSKAITALHDKFESVEKKCGGHDMKGMKH